VAQCFVKKPVQIEAIQYVGGENNTSEIGDFIGGGEFLSWRAENRKFVCGYIKNKIGEQEEFIKGDWIIKSGDDKDYSVLSDIDFVNLYEAL